MNPAHERWAAYERDLLLPPHLRSVPETRDSWAWNDQRRAQAEAKAKAEAEEAERARAELIAEVEELRAHARRALAELKAENAAHQRREALRAEIHLAHLRRLYAAWCKLAAKAGFSPDQPRVPAGNPDGGQWTSGEDGANSGANSGGFLTGVEVGDGETPANDFDLGALFSESSALGEAQDFDSSPLRVADLADAGDPLVLSDALPDSIFPPGSVVAQAETDRNSTVVLSEEEARGGHTIERHVGRSGQDLLATLSQRRSVFPTFSLVGKREGAFSSIEAANDFVNRTLERNKSMVDAVASGRIGGAFVTSRFGFVTGQEAFRPSPDAEPYLRNTFGVGVEIRHDPRNPHGFRVHTAYPRND